MGQAALGIDQRIMSVERDALVKIRDRKLGIAVNQERPSAFEIRLGVVWVELNGAVKVCERAIKVELVRSNVTAVEVCLGNVVVIFGQVRIQFTRGLVICNRTVQIAAGSPGLASI